MDVISSSSKKSIAANAQAVLDKFYMLKLFTTALAAEAIDIMSGGCKHRREAYAQAILARP